MMPESLFTQTKRSELMVCLKYATMELNINHHSAEPVNTPNIMAVEDVKSDVPEASPRPAKIAVNDNIVTGLVRVKKKVEIKLFKRPLLATFASFVAGLLRNDLIPRYNKNRPPISFMTNSCEVKIDEIAIMPKPATAP